MPSPALVGYWHNWNTVSAPYVQLDEVDARYNVVDVAFAVPKVGTDYNMIFIPYGATESNFIKQIQNLQSQGKKVLISVGGANDPISLDNKKERDIFISSMLSIINTYGFDGIDLDLEGASLILSGGTISNPIDSSIVNLIYAIKEIMNTYHISHGKKLLLTMAPETAFVQGGMSGYGSIWGAYLPIIHALKDSLDLLHVQLYNSGSMNGLDGKTYNQGTCDFILAMTESVILGFHTSGGWFSGLPAHKIAVGLPACPSAAGGGFADTSTVSSAMRYILGKGLKPNSYKLSNSYPNLGGMMTWSINWDAVYNCNNSAYEYAKMYESIFGKSIPSVVKKIKNHHHLEVYPNPTDKYLNIPFGQFKINNMIGQIVMEGDNFSDKIEISTLIQGYYFITIMTKNEIFIAKFLKK